jgi:hypothetical protein
MEIAEYIRNEISNHMQKHRVMVLKSTIDEMVEEAMKGTYAFQIIYNDIDSEDRFKARMFNFSLYSFIKLDHSKIVFREETEQTSAAYSYDGGKRFQWFDTETLLLNPSIIREMKLNQIIK